MDKNVFYSSQAPCEDSFLKDMRVTFKASRRIHQLETTFPRCGKHLAQSQITDQARPSRQTTMVMFALTGKIMIFKQHLNRVQLV